LADAEAYRILKTNVDLYCRKNGATCFAVTSGGISEGKSTTVHNLAIAWAAAGRRVLIIDGDIYRASQHRLFGVENKLGLSHCLNGKATLDDVILATTVRDVYVVPAGLAPKSAGGVLRSESMKQLLDAARTRFDVVLIDSPPILGVSAALIFSSLADCSIVVVQQRRFPRSMLQGVENAIEHIGGRILGVVLNKVNVTHDPNYLYSMNYVYHYSRRPGLNTEPV